MKTTNKVLCPKQRVIYLYLSKNGNKIMAAGKIGISVFAIDYSLRLQEILSTTNNKTLIRVSNGIHAKEAVRNSMWLSEKYNLRLDEDANLYELSKKYPDKNIEEPPEDYYLTQTIISDKIFK